MEMLLSRMRQVLIYKAVNPFFLWKIFLQIIGYTINKACQQDSFHSLQPQKQSQTYKLQISLLFIMNLVKLLNKPMLIISILIKFNPVCLLDRNQPLTFQVTSTHNCLILLLLKARMVLTYLIVLVLEVLSNQT